MKKLSTILFFIIFVPSFVFAQVSSQPVSTTDLQKQIQDLLKQVQALQQQITALQAELGKQPEKVTPAVGTPSATVTSEAAKPEAVPPEFTRSLSRGSSGDDVRKLQEFLARDKEIYPDGLITGYFGPLTEAAVKKWQEKHQIESVGVVGPKSIAKLQELGRGVVQELMQQGAGASGNIPPGLINAPGMQKKIEISTVATSSTTTTTLLVATTTLVVATTTLATATTTSSGTLPTTPIIPSSGVGTVVVPATPAVSAQPATTTTTTTTTTPMPITTASSTPTSDTTAPSIPTHLEAAALSSSQIFLSWWSSMDNVGVAGYKIYRNGLFVVSVNVNTYSDTSLATSTTYSYAVAAYDVAGNVSLQSSSVSATTLNWTAPITPTNLTYSLTNSNATVNLSWTDNSVNETRFEILKRVQGSFVYIGQVGANITTFSDSPPAGSYDYDVQACNGGAIGTGCSTSPPPVTVTVGGSISDTTAPSVPTGVYLSSPLAGYSSVNLYWNASTDNIGVVGYKVYYQNGVFLLDVPSTLPREVDNLSTGYSYTVAAYDAAGNISTQSNSVSAITPPAPVITVDLKVNGQDSPPSVPYNSVITATWTSTGAYRCERLGSVVPLVSGGNWVFGATPLSGSEALYARHANFGYENVSSLALTVRCFPSSAYTGEVSDTVNIPLNPPTTATTTSLQDPRVKNLAAISQSLNAIKEQLVKLLQGL